MDFHGVPSVGMAAGLCHLCSVLHQLSLIPVCPGLVQASLQLPPTHTACTEMLSNSLNPFCSPPSAGSEVGSPLQGLHVASE